MSVPRLSQADIRELLAIETAIRTHGRHYMRSRFEGIADEVIEGEVYSAEGLHGVLRSAMPNKIRGPWRIASEKVEKAQLFGQHFSVAETLAGLAALRLSETFEEAHGLGLTQSSPLRRKGFSNAHRELRSVLQRTLKNISRAEIAEAWEASAKVAVNPHLTLAGHYALREDLIARLGEEEGGHEYQRRMAEVAIESFVNPLLKIKNVRSSFERLISALDTIERLDAAIQDQNNVIRAEEGGSVREVFIRTNLATCYEDIFSIRAGRSMIGAKSDGPFVRFAFEFFKCAGDVTQKATVGRAFSAKRKQPKSRPDKPKRRVPT